MKSDSPIVEEVRQRAKILSARFGDDLMKYAEHLREIEAKYKDRVVDQITVVKSPGPIEEAEKFPESGKTEDRP